MEGSKELADSGGMLVIALSDLGEKVE